MNLALSILALACHWTCGPVTADTTAALTTIEPLEHPFWKEKKKVFEAIQNDRQIAVSVKTLDSVDAGDKKRGQHKLLFLGAGVVSAPRPFVFELSKNFDNLKKVSSMVKDVNFDAGKRLLYVHVSSLGVEIKMWMEVEFRRGVLRNGKSADEIRWVVRRGKLTGMTGVMSFEDDERRRTQISLTADYFYNKINWPNFMVEFGFEFVIQSIASKMRSFAEEMQRGSRE
jgi:hypothetical protein